MLLNKALEARLAAVCQLRTQASLALVAAFIDAITHYLKNLA